MSIVRMRKFFRTRGRAKIGKRTVHLPSPAEAIFYLIILIFVAGAYYTFGGPVRGHRWNEGRQGKVAPVVAVVNGEKIPRTLFELNLANRQELGGGRDVTQERWTKIGLLNSLIEATLLRQAAKREKIRVTKEDIRQRIEEEVEQTLNTRFPDKRALKRYLKKQHQTLDEYKAELRREIAREGERLREQIAQEKLRELVEQRVTLTDDELRDSFTEVRAFHILIKPEKEAERAKAKGQTPAGDPDALAKQKAEALLAQLKQGADFAQLAKQYSDDPGSAPRGGDLGYFKRGMMVKEFEDVAFKLQPGQLSEPFKSPFGYHIVKVVDRRTNLPKDFEKNKATYREQVLSERKFRAWSEYQDNLKKQAKIEILDPELQAYQLLQEAEQASSPDKLKIAQAKALLEQAVQQNPQNATALWELARLYEEEGNKQRAAEILETAIQTEEGARSPAMHMKLGDLYLDLSKQGAPAQQASWREKAIQQYKDAFDWASAFTPLNYFSNLQLETKLKELKQAELAKQVSKWLADYRAEQAKNPSGGLMPMPLTIPSR